MIEASIGAVSGLLPVFCAVAALFALPTVLVARAKNRPLAAPTLLAVSVAGVFAVTLLPGNAGNAMEGLCDTGRPIHMLTSSSALLNIALFIPVALFGVLVFRRPLTVAAVGIVASGTIELIQATGSLGRACSATDMAANATGAILGVSIATVSFRLRGTRTSHLVRDLCWGVGIAVVGTAGLAGWFHSGVTSVDVVATMDRRDDHLQSLDGSDEWMATAVEDVFGKGTVTKESNAEFSGERTRISVKTDRGELVGWWPDKSLERAWASDNRGEAGDLTEAQVRSAGHKFAQRQFPDSVAGSRESLTGMGEGSSKVYVLTYRRYVKSVMMPMRLDVTVTSAGRIMGFTSTPTPDPMLPPSTISQAKAQQLAAKAAGAKSDAAVLLAQKVNGRWRPVWMVSVKSDAEDPNLFIDAVNGKRITPDLHPPTPGLGD
ncbi:VanZ family protein [Streptomyces sp. NPDC058991]|uniref:VanZ family protein n=1 Tax=unclassified Streptomyces TaxID=2593676 RepID=UPI00369B76A1